MSDMSQGYSNELIKIEIDANQRSSGVNANIYNYNNSSSKNPKKITVVNRNAVHDITNNMQALLDEGIGAGSIQFTNFLRELSDNYEIDFNQAIFNNCKDGNSDIKIVLLIAFCNFLNISFDKLLGWESRNEDICNNSQITWLWNEDDTKTVEENANKIWIITPDFYYDQIDMEFKKVVKNNIINRGCEYRYIYKEDDNTIPVVEHMKKEYEQEFKKNGKDAGELDRLVKFLPVSKKKFHWISEMIIFNPEDENEKAILVDVNGKGRLDIKQKINVELSIKDRWAFKNMFSSYWKQEYGKALNKKQKTTKKSP